LAHANAKLNVAGRLLIIERLQAGWTQAQVATAQGVSRTTVAKWCRRFRLEGEAGLRDRSSRPKRTPHALGEDVIEAICRLRRELGVGPHRIAWELGLQASTVYGVLKRAGLAVLACLDRSTRAVIRYERSRPGELVHLDIKQLGRVPEGGGKRMDPAWQEAKAAPQRGKRGGGYDYLHVAVDDHSRFAYAEALPDQRGPTTADFLVRAVLAFSEVGVRVERVLTDNGGCYRSQAFAEAAAQLGVKLRHTRPFRPQTNGKAEAFNKTLQREWAYQRVYLSNTERLQALSVFIDDYNYVRPHTSIGNRPPASRLVNNVGGKYS
jgi:transposase InsO family protein